MSVSDSDGRGPIESPPSVIISRNSLSLSSNSCCFFFSTCLTVNGAVVVDGTDVGSFSGLVLASTFSGLVSTLTFSGLTLISVTDSKTVVSISVTGSALITGFSSTTVFIVDSFISISAVT